ncbi:MAG: hypothetical protein ACNA7O_14320 [Rhodobacterales bacterium]
MQHNRVARALRSSLPYLAPPASTAHARAAAADDAVEALNKAKRAILRAGLASTPDCDLLAPLEDLQGRLTGEADALRSLTITTRKDTDQ